MEKSNTVIEPTKVVETRSDIVTNKNDEKTWKKYMTLAKMGIVTSNLITTFAGLFLASVYTGVSLIGNLHVVILTLIGAGLVMAGSCTINNFIDRDIDPLMERTKDRPTVKGTVAPKNVLLVGLFQSITGLVLLAATELTAAIIGFIGLFVYVVIYSMWLKRTHSINTIVGSISGAVPPLIGWAAVDPGLHYYAWMLFVIMFIWQPPHFLALAMRRCKEYKAAGVPMLPVVAGFDMTKRQIIVYIAALIPLTLFLYPFGWTYTIVAGLLGLGWLLLGLIGYKKRDSIAWAKAMFVYSVNYLTILFVLMVIVHL